MTTMVAWTVYRPGHPPQPSSLYFASDSRITWGSHKSFWDGARKLFACRIEPHIFGYCGDVVFPSLVLAQIVSAVDNGVLFRNRASAQEMHEIVYESFKTSFEQRQGTPDESFSVLHALRTGEEDTREFFAWQIAYNKKQKAWSTTPLAIPQNTGIITILGSGTSSAKKYIDRWLQSDVGARSSAIFSGFCDSVFSAEDPHSGGKPQIAALNTGSHAQIIGFIDEGGRYLNGLKILPVKTLRRIKWFDRQLQRINPTTLKRPARARRLVRPPGL